jgi:V/A-type H+-transporting ATPase subunit F
MEGKVAVLGNKDFVMPYSALGVDCFAADEKSAVIDSAKQILSQQYTLVLVAENIATAADEVFAETTTKPLPSVVVVPFTTESKGYTTQKLGKLMKQATGINIFSGDN